ncbi:MAG: hypothetical protein NZ903_00780 [Candidatus Micrarchaeota archaeon]|nr:hypothetical protein [Candidatus Micrarchaeota archaeon]
MKNTYLNISIFVLLSLFYASFSFNLDDYLSPNESPMSVLQDEFKFGQTNYKIITIANKESIILKNNEIVRDLDEIKSVLKLRCFINSYPSNSTLSSIRERVLAFNASRNIQTSLGNLEDFCDSITGQSEGDEGGCYDLVSCQVACNKGSYACFQYAAGSAQFLPALLNYANIKRGIDSNVSKILQKLDRLSTVTSHVEMNFDLSAELKSISDSIVLLQDLAQEYNNNKLFTRPIYNFCVPVGYSLSLNTTALSSAASIVSQLRSSAACFGNIDSSADAIFNETFRRIDLYTKTKAKTNLQRDFDNLSTRYNYFLDKTIEILDLVNDSTLSEQISSIESLKQRFYTELNGDKIDQAGYTLSLIKSKLDEMESYISSTYAIFEVLSENREKTNKLLEKASVVITPSDAAFYPELEKLMKEIKQIDSKLSDGVVYEEIESIALSYEEIGNKLDSLIERKKKATTETIPAVLSSSFNGIAVSVLETVSVPLGIRESEKRVWAQNIPLIIIVGMDVIVLLIFAIIFFFFILRNTSEFGRSKVIRSWIFIFAALIIVLALLSYALYGVINNEISSTSIYNFIAQTEKSNKVYLFIEYLSSENPNAIKMCGDEIASKFYGKGIDVETVEVVDGICKDKLLSECMVETGKEPLIHLSYSNQPEIQFYTFYRPEGIIKGNESYFVKCNIAEFIE